LDGMDKLCLNWKHKMNDLVFIYRSNLSTKYFNLNINHSTIQFFFFLFYFLLRKSEKSKWNKKERKKNWK
jgi:hypothetical protein